jgi:hypothetical protein
MRLGEGFAPDCLIRQRVPESDILQRNAHITVKPLLMNEKKANTKRDAEKNPRK